MTTLSQASSFNAEASLNAWMVAALTAITRPAWLPTLPTMVMTAPQKTAVLPAFSLIHLPVGAMDEWQGRWAGTSKGLRTLGMLDVSCWVSRTGSKDWLMQLRTMRDMVKFAATADSVILIYDYAAIATDATPPAATAYKIDLGNITETPVEPDSNPDVERVRVIIDYSYVSRAS